MTTLSENCRELSGQLRLVAKLTAELAVKLSSMSTKLAAKLARVSTKLSEAANELAVSLSYSETAPKAATPLDNSERVELGREIAGQLRLVAKLVAELATETTRVSAELAAKLSHVFVELVELISASLRASC